MTKLTDFTRYDDALKLCTPAGLWALFDGDREHFNIAHECLDRHARSDRVAVIVAHAAGHDEVLTYAELARDAARFAHYLAAQGIGPGDRVAVMLEPSHAFYTSIFGALKRGAIAVPLFTLFGPDGIRLRVQDCQPRLLVTNPEKAPLARALDDVQVLVVDADFPALLAPFPDHYASATRADDVAMFQYTSGTTRELPEAVHHTQRAIVTLMLAALYGTGLRPGERFFCPSSPAWGHGLWHGTLAPLALGLTIGAYAGKFDAERLLRALAEHRFTNISAAATHYRMIRHCGVAAQYSHALTKLSFTGEPLDSETAEFLHAHFGIEACSLYGTTEIGVVLGSYPGAPDFRVKRGSLGRPVPGVRVEVQDPAGEPCAPGVLGELKVWRRAAWVATRDLGRSDEEGYFWHGGRADDVIISAGWTMSAVEIEDTILQHPAVLEAAVIAVPDALRGQIAKAFVVAREAGSEALSQAIQLLVRSRLSQHEYPRLVAFVAELPKTQAGKINRKVLRERPD